VLAVDRDAAALAGLAGLRGITTLCAELEAAAWPLAGQRFGLVVVTRYLWRPRFAELLDCLAPGGLLLYETFARGHELLGRPTRAEFLLEDGELLERCRGVASVLAYEQVRVDEPAPAFVQRIAARRIRAEPPARPESLHPVDAASKDAAPAAPRDRNPSP
jgi:SAM-dependent methyltransferase